MLVKYCHVEWRHLQGTNFVIDCFNVHDYIYVVLVKGADLRFSEICQVWKGIMQAKSLGEWRIRWCGARNPEPFDQPHANHWVAEIPRPSPDHMQLVNVAKVAKICICR